MAVPEIRALRHFLFADFHTVSASGGKRAALGRIQQIGRRSGYGCQLLFVFQVKARYGFDQRPGIGMPWAVKNVRTLSLFHDHAGIHDRDILRQIRHNAQVMGDNDNGCIMLLLQILDDIQNLPLDSHIHAVVGSSQIRSFGSQAKAMAIMTRWRIPPENS